MDPNPNPIRLIDEKIDVVIAATDRSQLGSSFLLERVGRKQAPSMIVEQLVIHLFGVF